ncbi:hypothetical protein QJQ45_015314 [Haematococcus lacustris]|nr:hypothetical protein QJQ45_015314 [Haematococcus lacustris]
MVAPWAETPSRVVVEFRKGNAGASRVVNLTHRPDVIPPQLYGRIDPQVWAGFMAEVQHLAAHHPYTAPMPADKCCSNVGGFLCALVVGFGCFEPDGGNYGQWTAEVTNCIHRHQPAFAAAGATLSLQQVHGSYWIQLDLAPALYPSYGVPVVQAVSKGADPAYPPVGLPPPAYDPKPGYQK